MIIAEQFIQGKHDAESCEDGIVINKDFVAVIDGSTSKGLKRMDPNMSNGRYCMLAVAHYIQQMSATISLAQFCEGITATIHAIYEKSGVLDSSLQRSIAPIDRLCASAVIYSHHRKEIWMIGDCQCMVDGELFTNSKPSEAEIAAERAEIFATQVTSHPDMISNGHIVHDYARDAVLPALISSMDGENITYAVIDGYPIYRNGIKVIDVNGSEAGKNIILATDGYPFLCRTLEKSERKLRKQLKEDPFNIHSFKATKGLMTGNVSFDDRAYVRFSPADEQRYFLTLSFDGTGYHGWQIQPNGVSVQEQLQNALSKILQHKIEVTGAGRTDAGVHAKTMVCHFDDVAGYNDKQMIYRLNQLLPKDIACQRLIPVPSTLHARFSATRRTYRYFIHIDKNPFNRHFSVETHYQLDFPLMNHAAELLVKTTDFKAFCKADNDSRTTTCHVTRAQWIQTSPSEWYFEISADRFLRNMVRAVVGTLFDVGRHRINLEDFADVVAHGSRSDSGESMPAKGLFLWEIEY